MSALRSLWPRACGVRSGVGEGPVHRPPQRYVVFPTRQNISARFLTCEAEKALHARPSAQSEAPKAPSLRRRRPPGAGSVREAEPPRRSAVEVAHLCADGFAVGAAHAVVVSIALRSIQRARFLYLLLCDRYSVRRICVRGQNCDASVPKYALAIGNHTPETEIWPWDLEISPENVIFVVVEKRRKDAYPPIRLRHLQLP